MLEQAIQLARKGFWVFPIREGAKLPPLVKFKEEATRDEKKIQEWFAGQRHNIGVYTGKFGSRGEALLVVDVDNKGAKRGDDTLLALEFDAKEFPATYTQYTPTGGRHLVYSVPYPVKQGVEVLGGGLDIRSRGGYIVGAGSVIGGAIYLGAGGDPVPAPEWLTQACASTPARKVVEGTAAVIPPERAAARAIRWLERHAPLAIQGSGGDATTFAVAARVRDYGVGENEALGILLQHWNDRCSPPWDPSDLGTKLRNAYAYAQNQPGVRSPESIFPVVRETVGRKLEGPPKPTAIGGVDGPAQTKDAAHPFDRLKNHAYIIASNMILWQTTDAKGRECIEYLTMQGFANTFAPHDFNKGKLTKAWMEWDERPTYQGVVFDPKGGHDPRFYNLWRGWGVKPADTHEDHPAVRQWVEHLHENICQKDEALTHWLLGYFAHMIQRPWEKPLVALVLRGAKGVGKNALVIPFSRIMGGHYLLSSSRRHLVGNFNGHLENLLAFVLDEALWAGDKQGEGVLKDLITGDRHVIEHKGQKIYTVDNLTRIIILGNEDWLVPASKDERRYAVFNVGDGRKQDRDYFDRLRVSMANGGASALLRYLQDYDFSGVDVNAAPFSQGLLDQKNESLQPFEHWWLECLETGGIVGGENSDNWPETIKPDRFKAAFIHWTRGNNIKSRLPSQLPKELEKIGIKRRGTTDCTAREGKEVHKVYRLPPLNECRAAWVKFIGQEVTWE